jgi:hypothetical protein
MYQLESILVQYIIQIIPMIRLAFYYALGVMAEYVQYWYVYLLLRLPPWMFNLWHNEVALEVEEGQPRRNIWIIMVKLILLKGSNQFETEVISGTQLLLLADKQGRIPINLLELYYPNLDIMYIQYLDLKQHLTTSDTGTTSKYEGLSFVEITKVIDIKKRTDISADKKCLFGRIHI